MPVCSAIIRRKCIMVKGVDGWSKWMNSRRGERIMRLGSSRAYRAASHLHAKTRHLPSTDRDMMLRRR